MHTDKINNTRSGEGDYASQWKITPLTQISKTKGKNIVNVPSEQGKL